MSKNPFEKVLILAAGFSLGAATLGLVIEYGDRKFIPSTEKVQEGYVAPSNLEITVEDKDKTDALPETYMKIDGVSYVLKYDKNGEPTLLHYIPEPMVIKPAPLEQTDGGVKYDGGIE